MPDRRLLLLGVLLFAACGFFLLWGLRAPMWFILELRAVKLAALLLVGAAIGVSTVIFQTVTGNRILTPAIMGFDALFLLIQTLLVFLLGGSAYVALLGPAKFLVETAIMMVAAMVLFSVLLGRGRTDIHRMILTGVIVGVLFRSLTVFFQRILDPSEFSVVQSAMFASFNSVEVSQLALASGVCLACLAALGPLYRALDVVALGRNVAIGLGLPYDRLVLGLLALVAALVSVSTALVGPITFLGLLIAALAHSLMKTHRHALLLPAAAMISMLVLVTGQAFFERVLRMQSTLSVIVEFVGGVLFLYLVLRGRVR